uniref:Zinc finger GATA like protein 1 n=1 Tax=Salarias fasciatus TaxID=181472 RepID=A0A672GDS6_SALFA
MSSDRRTQATSIPEEQDVSPSALFYLFQEVSKLASSAHDSFPDKDSPLNQLDEVRRKDLIVVKNEVKDARLIQTSNISCQKNKPHMCKYSQVKEESRDEKALTSLESQCESKNPWTPPSDGCPPSPSCVTPLLASPSPTFSTAGICRSVSKQNDKITASDCTLVPTDGKTAPVSQQRSSVSSSSTPSQKETWEQQDEELGRPSTCQWKTKKPRKQPHPCRSADSHDPDFQGVTFRMDTQLDDTREQCRLCITSKYSKELLKSTRKPKLRTRTSQNFHKTSSSEEESESKVCASCCTRKTPMWRDAEDGTPLCNACGIRYKKYRVRCVNCWHIPRKEGNSSSHCLKCGNFVKPTSQGGRNLQ